MELSPLCMTTGMAPPAAASAMDFGLSQDAPSLLGSPRRAAHTLAGASAWRICDDAAPRVRRSRRSRLAVAPLASIGVSAAQPGETSPQQPGDAAKVPLFMLASASASPAAPSNAPAWRVAVGNLAAGAVSGCAVEAALYPIDTIKTRLQAAIGGGGVRALLQSGGGKGLYAGVFQNLAGVAPASAIFISTYEPVKKWVESQVSPERSYLGPIAGGAAAGIMSSVVRVPTEVIKSRLQTGEVKGAVAAIRSIVAKQGVTGLYAGYGAFLLRDLPFDAIEFVVYEQVKRAAQKTLGREVNTGETSIIGAFAGGFTGIATTPLDVLKTRLMVSGTAARYNNLLHAATTIIKEEGVSAMMKGWQPRLIWISLGGFVFFPVLEASKKFFAPKPEMEVTPLK